MKIILVDDEPIVLKGVSTIIEKADRDDWRVVGQCTSAEEALALLDTAKPDVMMTDIRMNGISGLELIGLVKEKHEDMVVILLTGYADFDFARQAIKLGAFDYLLKPTRYPDILACLQKAETHLRQLKDKREAEKCIRDSLFDSKAAAKEKLLLDLMKGLYPVGQDTEELCRRYDLQAGRYLVIAVRHIQQRNVFGKDSKDKNMQNYAMKNIVSELFSEYGGVVAVADSVERFFAVLLLSESYDEEALFQKAELLSDTAGMAIGVRAWIGVSAPCAKIDDLCVCYAQAEHCLTLAQQSRSGAAFFSRLHFSKPEKGYSDNISKALAYIESHYQESLSLKDVAEHVYLNIWYFSDLFKREVGKSFTDYVTELRIARAKELLKDRKKKLYQISYQVGINEPAYFSQLFKKVTGQSPKEYRDTCGGH